MKNPKQITRRLLTVAALALVATSGSAEAATTSRLVDRALEEQRITPADAMIFKLCVHGNRRAIPQDLRGNDQAPSRDLTPLLAQARRLSSQFSPARRAEIASYVQRPTDSGTDPACGDWSTYDAPQTLDTAHFKIHWVQTLASDHVTEPPDAPPDMATITELASTLENVYDAEVTGLGWAVPPSDGVAGGDARTDVYLCELTDESVYGYVGAEPGAGRTAPSYMVLDDDFVGYSSAPALARDVTVAHEFNHMLQFGYDVKQDTWMMESTATWMEDQVYGTANDYLNYLTRWAASPHASLTLAVDGHEYGSAVWNIWLSDTQLYGQDMILRAWQQSALDSNSIGDAGFAPAAYSDAINDEVGGTSFSENFERFAVATAEWRQEVPVRFPDGADYPEMWRRGILAVGGNAVTVGVDHAAYSIYDIPVPATGDVRLRAWADDSTVPVARTAVALVGRKPSGTVVTQFISMKSPTAVMTLPSASQFARISLVLVNADSATLGQLNPQTGDWAWANDNIQFKARVDGGNLAPVASAEVLTKSPTAYSPVVFSSTSTDANPDDKLRHSWDLDSDGDFDDGDGPVADATYLKPGLQTIQMRVIDDFGLASDYTMVVSVAGGAQLQDPNDLAPIFKANLARLPRAKSTLRLRGSINKGASIVGTVKRKGRTIASARTAIATGGKVVLNFRLKRATAKLLRKRRKLTVTIRIVATDITRKRSVRQRKTVLKYG